MSDGMEMSCSKTLLNTSSSSSKRVASKLVSLTTPAVPHDACSVTLTRAGRSGMVCSGSLSLSESDSDVLATFDGLRQSTQVSLQFRDTHLEHGRASSHRTLLSRQVVHASEVLLRARFLTGARLSSCTGGTHDMMAVL